MNAVGGTLASQWKEYFYLDAMPEGVLAAKANKKTKGRFGGSRHEDEQQRILAAERQRAQQEQRRERGRR